AYVVAREGRAPEAAALIAHCRARVSGAKVPREIVWLEALPRTPTGKVKKGDLRGAPAVAPAGAAPDASK
ncbi:MAG TPA: hypothetical protein VFS00_30345, partial [Polyangiaceae bacterium]|nr:hypothetical protein [Polyangiaceae bacterium]